MFQRFRYDYVDDQPPEAIPGFTKLLKTGVRAEFMSPIFPSVSYPDWTTLVTGLYPESHGIVGNYFYDAQTKENFSLFDKTSTKKPKVIIYLFLIWRYLRFCGLSLSMQWLHLRIFFLGKLDTCAVGYATMLSHILQVWHVFVYVSFVLMLKKGLVWSLTVPRLWLISSSSLLVNFFNYLKFRK